MATNDERHKRKVHRSPSYPAFDLGEAIAKAEVIYKNEKRSATTGEVIASHLGYSTATGPGGRAVSALRQYGLIEESGGKYRLSDLGYTLIHFSRQSDEWRGAISVAIRNPTLFRELLDEYHEGLPSDATLRNELLKREFNPTSIQDVVGIIRNTMSLADRDDMVHNDGEEAMPTSTNARVPVPSGIVFPPVSSASKTYSWPLGMNVHANLQIQGGYEVEDLELIKEYIDLAIKAMKRTRSADTRRSTGEGE